MPLRSLLRRSRSRPSIRQWLLGASLLAVLGGYGALVVTQSLLAARERRAAHLQTLARLADQLPLAAGLTGTGSAAMVFLPPTLLLWLERPDRLPLALARVSPEFPLPQGRTAWGLMAETRQWR